MSERYLYLIATVHAGVETSPIKIGIATNPRARLRELQTASPYLLALHEYWQVDLGARFFEAEIHDALTDKRLRGEWFDLEPLYARMWVEVMLQCALLAENPPQRVLDASVHFGERARRGELEAIHGRPLAQIAATL